MLLANLCRFLFISVIYYICQIVLYIIKYNYLYFLDIQNIYRHLRKYIVINMVDYMHTHNIFLSLFSVLPFEIVSHYNFLLIMASIYFRSGKLEKFILEYICIYRLSLKCVITYGDMQIQFINVHKKILLKCNLF